MPKSDKLYGAPASVTWSLLLHKQTNMGSSTALTAQTHWSTSTWLSVISRIVASAYNC